jgi:hypothetical protein
MADAIVCSNDALCLVWVDVVGWRASLLIPRHVSTSCNSARRKPFGLDGLTVFAVDQDEHDDGPGDLIKWTRDREKGEH